MLIAKSGYIRKMIVESNETDLSRINLSDVPGGAPIFEKAAKFCYGVNFEINVHNVAALICAAEFLEMTDKYCEGNLAGRTEEFLTQVALMSFSAALLVLKTCQDLLPLAEELNIVQRCVDVISSKVSFFYIRKFFLPCGSCLILIGLNLIQFNFHRPAAKQTFQAVPLQIGGQKNYRSWMWIRSRK